MSTNSDIPANLVAGIPAIPAHRKEAVLNAVRDKKSRFGLVPSPKLREMVMKNEHPFIVPLARKIKAAIIFFDYNSPDNVVGPLSRDLVEQYVLGTLDERTKFIFDHSNIILAGGNDGNVSTQPDVVESQ